TSRIKMTQLISYLTFNGNCREAMTFYHNCLGGELYLQTVRDSPVAHELPERMKDCILHASLQKENLRLMGTDMVGESGLQRGNTVSLLLACQSEHELHRYYKELSKGGRQTQ